MIIKHVIASRCAHRRGNPVVIYYLTQKRLHPWVQAFYIGRGGYHPPAPLSLLRQLTGENGSFDSLRSLRMTLCSRIYCLTRQTMDSTWLHLGNRSAAMAFFRA